MSLFHKPNIKKVLAKVKVVKNESGFKTIDTEDLTTDESLAFFDWYKVYLDFYELLNPSENTETILRNTFKEKEQIKWDKTNWSKYCYNNSKVLY